MNATEFRTALKQHDLSQIRIAAFFKTYPRQVRRWADGKEAVPQIVEEALTTRPQDIIDQT